MELYLCYEELEVKLLSLVLCGILQSNRPS